MIYTIIVALLALLVGGVIGWLIARLKSGRLAAEVEVLRARLADREAQHADALARERKSAADTMAREQRVAAAQLADRDRAHADALAHERQSAAEALTAQRRANADALEALQGRFDETVAKMKAEIENLTGDMLRQRQEEFERASSLSVSKILEPLNTSISEMRKAVSENTARHTEFGGKLSENIRTVIEQSEAARKSADRLADALSGSNRAQGVWGETILAELLESQGLKEGIHFETQAVIRDETGNVLRNAADSSMRPDVILHLDSDRDVVIDSKVSLSAYLDYVNADSDEKRAAALAAHIRSIEKHVAELERKDYAGYLGGAARGIDYVIMFVPSTAALYAATDRRPDLWRKAMERGVYIADEQTLYAALKIISLTWRQIQQAENHEQVYKLANEMLERVNTFMQKFAGIGSKLDDARKAYDEAFGKLQEKGQSIPQTCNKLIKMGAKVAPKRGVDPTLLGLDQ